MSTTNNLKTLKEQIQKELHKRSNTQSTNTTTYSIPSSRPKKHNNINNILPPSGLLPNTSYTQSQLSTSTTSLNTSSPTHYPLKKKQKKYLEKVLKQWNFFLPHHLLTTIEDTIERGYYYENDKEVLNRLRKRYPV